MKTPTKPNQKCNLATFSGAPTPSSSPVDPKNINECSGGGRVHDMSERPVKSNLVEKERFFFSDLSATQKARPKMTGSRSAGEAGNYFVDRGIFVCW